MSTRVNGKWVQVNKVNVVLVEEEDLRQKVANEIEKKGWTVREALESAEELYELIKNQETNEKNEEENETTEISVCANYEYATEVNCDSEYEEYLHEDADIVNNIIEIIEQAGYEVGSVNESNLIPGVGYYINIQLDNFDQVGEKDDLKFPEWVDGYTFTKKEI